MCIGKTASGRAVIYDDFREAYSWVSENTPAPSIILSWWVGVSICVHGLYSVYRWDYGYQIAAMTNRTVIIDNNTWNHTHIATVGRILISNETAAYPLLHALDVDYVAVVFGGITGFQSDDISKYLWPLRIGRCMSAFISVKGCVCVNMYIWMHVWLDA